MQNAATLSAVRVYKELNGLPINNDFSDSFIKTLKNAVAEQEKARLIIESQPAPRPEVKVADLSGSVANLLDFNGLYAPRNETPSSRDISSDISLAPAYNLGANSSGSTLGLRTESDELSHSAGPSDINADQKEVALILPTDKVIGPNVKDEIVEVKLTRPARVSYPRTVLKGKVESDAAVSVIYDISEKGRAQNLRLGSIEFDGDEIYKSDFEKAAMKAISSQRFTPKTVNGDAVIDRDRVTLIRFNVQ